VSFKGALPEARRAALLARRHRGALHRMAIHELVAAVLVLHARRGTLNLPSTQRAIARYVF